jgi:ABC-type transport system substrate-binding protein
MTKKLVLVLALLVACSVLVAGCGGGSKSSNTETAAQATSSPPPPPPPPPAAATTSGKTPTTMNAAIAQAVASCKTSVDNSQLDASTKSDLKALCQKAASGDVKAVQKAAREICRKIVEKNIPAGDTRTKALASCDQAAAGSTTP